MALAIILAGFTDFFGTAVSVHSLRPPQDPWDMVCQRRLRRSYDTPIERSFALPEMGAFK